MKATLAILTIGVVPVSEVLPLLTEHVSEKQITHLSLLGKLSREEVMEDYAVGEGKIPWQRYSVTVNWRMCRARKSSARYRA